VGGLGGLSQEVRDEELPRNGRGFGSWSGKGGKGIQGGVSGGYRSKLGGGDSKKMAIGNREWQMRLLFVGNKISQEGGDTVSILREGIISQGLGEKKFQKSFP